MFSRSEVAEFIKQNFEAAWEMVRPVPLVRIDFGNGTVLTRTLNGNIATYVCTTDGQVLDVLPGIYEPAVYRDRLDQFRLLANYVDQQGTDKRAARLKEYHQGQAEALRNDQLPARLINKAFLSKRAIEGGILAMLVPSNSVVKLPSSSDPVQVVENNRFDLTEDLANWKALADDTVINETVRRAQIHEQLVSTGLVQPERIKKWLYKVVLHADLDDPYLGLGKVLFASYPFREGKGQ